jgi:hypothetical protein
VSHSVILGTEAVRALGDPTHRKHRRVVSHIQVVASRKRRAEAVQVVVPTAVRIEAGWDRASSSWAFMNRLRIADVPLDQAHGNVAAAIRSGTVASVADAHLGAVIHSSLAARVTIVTRHPEDVRLVAADRQVTIVAI